MATREGLGEFGSAERSEKWGPREMWKFDYHKIARTHPIELAEDDFIRDKLASTWLLTTSAAKPWESCFFLSEGV